MAENGEKLRRCNIALRGVGASGACRVEKKQEVMLKQNTLLLWGKKKVGPYLGFTISYLMSCIDIIL